MEKILIALDYDPSAQKVAETGHKLAKAMKANTFLLHVLSDFTYYSSLNYSPIMGFENFRNAVEAGGAEELGRVSKHYLERTKQHLNDKTIQTIVRIGNFAETILKTAVDFSSRYQCFGYAQPVRNKKNLNGKRCRTCFTSLRNTSVYCSYKRH
ncbi:MAG: universal stress protein [Chryseolinea sp.]